MKLETLKVQGTRAEKGVTSPVPFLSFLRAKNHFPKDMFVLFYTFKMSNWRDFNAHSFLKGNSLASKRIKKKEELLPQKYHSKSWLYPKNEGNASHYFSNVSSSNNDGKMKWLNNNLRK